MSGGPVAVERSRQRLSRDEVVADRAVVVAARPEAADAGIAMLRAGGNAVDAAVAVGFVAAVVEPMDTCVAGSGFLLVHEAASGRAWSVEFPPRAPAGARPDMYEVLDEAEGATLLGISPVRDDANVDGYLAPGVPGTVAGLCAASERFGRLPLPQVLEPAVALAERGFEADAYYSLQALAHLPVLRRHQEAARTYLVDGLPPVPAFMGRATLGVPPLVRQPDLAETLRRIARLGAPGFYEGEVAAAIEDDFRRHGGLITREDLGAYRPTIGEPLRGTYRDCEVLTARAPGGGWTVLQLLGVLERFDLAAMGHNSPAGLHALVEASRHAFADRYRSFADPDAVAVPLAELLGAEHLDALAARIEPDRAGLQDAFSAGPPWEAFAFPGRSAGSAPPGGDGAAAPGPSSARVRGGTTSFSVVDAEGNAVSCTHTAANAFGCAVVAAGTGVLFDSAMVWFNPRPGAANSIAPGKRPLVNMAPTLVRRGGRPLLAVGAPGGRRIASAVVQVISNVVDHGLSAQPAIDAPRVDASGSSVLASARIAPEVRDELARAGHRLVAVDEEHEPFLYEFARPVAALVDDEGRRRGGVDPFTVGRACGY